MKERPSGKFKYVTRLSPAQLFHHWNEAPSSGDERELIAAIMNELSHRPAEDLLEFFYYSFMRDLGPKPPYEEDSIRAQLRNREEDSVLDAIVKDFDSVHGTRIEEKVVNRLAREITEMMKG